MSNTNPNFQGENQNFQADFTSWSTRFKGTSESLLASGIWNITNDFEINDAFVMPENHFAVISKVCLLNIYGLVDTGVDSKSLTVIDSVTGSDIASGIVNMASDANLLSKTNNGSGFAGVENSAFILKGIFDFSSRRSAEFKTVLGNLKLDLGSVSAGVNDRIFYMIFGIVLPNQT